MVIHELTSDECLGVLSRAKVFRLACAQDNQPYIIPLSLAYDAASGHLYGFTIPGQKLDWMRANPRVCVEVDDVADHDQWVSVIIFGRYEELRERPACGGDADAVMPADQSKEAAANVLMRANASHDQDEPDGPDHDGRQRAWKVLKREPTWWQAGSAAWKSRGHRDRDAREPTIPVYYRIHLDQITGHQAIRGN